MQRYLRSARVSCGSAARVALLLAVGSIGLHAQVEPGGDNSGELAAYTGAAAGGVGSHALVGATTGLFVNRYGALLLGSTFVPLGSRTVVPNTLVTSRSRLYDTSFTLNIQIPVSRAWAPYGLASTSVLYNTYQIQMANPDGSPYLQGSDDVRFAFETG